MKVELQTAKLKEVIAVTERIAGKHATLPVLSCVLIDRKSTRLNSSHVSESRMPSSA